MQEDRKEDKKYKAQGGHDMNKRCVENVADWGVFEINASSDGKKRRMFGIERTW